jgi:hypothetical protein
MLLPVTGQSGKPVITFSEKEFSFGTIRASSGILTHDFKFSNTGKIPLIINDVKASCGCTVPEWPREPILPGRTGIIKVSFDPEKQSGSFSKTVQVSSNADMPVMTLFVKGVVVPSEEVDDAYKFTIGELRLQTIYAAVGEIYKGRSATVAIRVFNNSGDKAATLSFRQVPAHIKVRITPEILEPQQDGSIELEYITAGMKEWDYVVDRLELLINGKSLTNNRISVTANIREDFSKLSAAEMEAAPRVEFTSHIHDFGTIADKAVVEHDFTLTNKGKSDLFIRKVSASCGCTAVEPAKLLVAPGGSTTIRAVFNASGREGNQKKAITVITNDPMHSKSILWLNGVVVPAGKKPDNNP